MVVDTILCGNAWQLAPTLDDESVNCIVTSPPYWGLRDYGCEGQFGLEKTPDEYIARLVELFTLLHPKLRKDGTLFVNIGDSYLGSNCGSNDYREAGSSISKSDDKYKGQKPGSYGRAKDMACIPEMFVLTMRQAGWWKRNTIIWSKLNPMPESVTDRCTTAHEYIFFFTRSAKYWIDMDAVRQGNAREWDANNGGSISTGRQVGCKGKMGDMSTHPKGYPLPNPLGANLKTVWQFPTQPYHEAHFTTYPEKLPETCILMGCPQDGLVLDPFAGSGTTCAVAKRLRRHYLGFELNPEYVKLCEKRVAQCQQPMF